VNSYLKIGCLIISSTLSLTPLKIFAMSLDQCTKVSQMVNEKTPMRVDQSTTLKTSYCSDTSPKPTLNYLMTTDYDYIDLTGTRNMQKNSLCTNPKQRKLLEAVDVKYTYSKKDGKFLGITLIKLGDC